MWTYSDAYPTIAAARKGVNHNAGYQKTGQTDRS